MKSRVRFFNRNWTAILATFVMMLVSTDLFAYTEAEQRMREQSKNYDKAVWQGALIGAATGIGISVLTGGDTKKSILSGLSGALAGGLAGKYISSKQEEFGTREDQLDSMISDVKDSNKQNEAFIASVEEVLEEDKRKLASVNAKYKTGEVTREALKKEKERVRKNQEVVQTAVTGAKKKLEMFEGAQKKYSSKELGNELKTYNEQMKTLEDLADAFSVA